MKLESYLKERHTAKTANRYLREIQLFKAAIANPEEANYQQISNYLGSLRAHQINISVIRVVLHAIKKYYSYLQETNQREDHPCRYLRLRDPVNREVQLQDLFSENELEHLLEREERYPILKNRNQLIISLLIYQGLTTGEITRLEIKDVDLDRAEIEIQASKQLNARVLKLKANQILMAYKYLEIDRPKLKPTAENLIITKKGKPELGEGISYLTGTYKNLYPERNLNPKTIRQSVITNLLKAGQDLRKVQLFAGHKYPSSTERYKQTKVEELKIQVLKYHPLNN